MVGGGEGVEVRRKVEIRRKTGIEGEVLGGKRQKDGRAQKEGRTKKGRRRTPIGRVQLEARRLRREESEGREEELMGGKLKGITQKGGRCLKGVRRNRMRSRKK